MFEDAEGLSFTELVVDGNAADAPERAEVEPTQMPEATAEPTAEPENKKGFNDYGELLDLTETDGICVLKYKITSSATKKMTVNQNYYTVVNFIKDGGGDQYDEIQYWAVADMQDGSESKVISFTVSKDLIEKIKAGTVLPTKMGDYARKGFKAPLNFPLQASVPPLSGVFQQCIARRTKRLAPCPMHATTIPAHHEGNGFGLLFLVQVLKSFLFYTQLAQSNRLVEEKADHLYAVCLLPDAKARRRAGLTAPARARCRPVPSARC